MPHEFVPDLAQQIRRGRIWIDLSREQLAEEAKVSAPTLKNVETGKFLEPATVKKIVRVLNARLAAAGEHLIQMELAEVCPAVDSWLHLPERVHAWSWLGPGALLEARSRVVRFHGAARLKERDELVAWCNDNPEPAAIRLYTGAPGIGKTRLALEVCRQLKSAPDWEAGFLHLPLFPRTASPWKGIRGNSKNLLIVVDYAGGLDKTSALRSLLLGLDKCPARRVRLLLLERQDTFLGRLRDDSAICDLLDGPRLSLKQNSKSLPPVAPLVLDRKASFELASSAFARIASPQPVCKGTHPKGPDNPASPIYNQVLVLHMQAFLSVVGDQQPAQKEAILDRTLARERTYWRRLIAARGLPRSAEKLVEAAVVAIGACNGARSLPEALEICRGVSRLASLPDGELKSIVLLLRECYPDDGTGIAPLQPDLLRHHLADEWDDAVRRLGDGGKA